MSSNLKASGLIGAMIVVALFSAAAIASFSGGLHIEAGGMHVTMQADLEQGVQLIFAAATERG